MTLKSKDGYAWKEAISYWRCEINHWFTVHNTQVQTAMIKEKKTNEEI